MNNYDFEYISFVLNTIKAYQNEIENEYSEDAKEWYSELKDTCEDYIIDLEKRDLKIDEGTVEGELLASWIISYEFAGEEFDTPLTKELVKVSKNRENVITPQSWLI